MSELGERFAREEIEREERMEMLIDSGTSILRLCAAFAAQNKGSLCIVQRTEKSLLYETERALPASPATSPLGAMSNHAHALRICSLTTLI